MARIEQQTMDAIIGIYREIKRPKEIDWEQRRYEVAKTILPEIMGQINDYDKTITTHDICRYAVEMANALISELKKNVDYGKESL